MEFEYIVVTMHWTDFVILNVVSNMYMYVLNPHVGSMFLSLVFYQNKRVMSPTKEKRASRVST